MEELKKLVNAYGDAMYKYAQIRIHWLYAVTNGTGTVESRMETKAKERAALADAIKIHDAINAIIKEQCNENN